MSFKHCLFFYLASRTSKLHSVVNNKTFFYPTTGKNTTRDVLLTLLPAVPPPPPNRRAHRCLTEACIQLQNRNLLLHTRFHKTFAFSLRHPPAMPFRAGKKAEKCECSLLAPGSDAAEHARRLRATVRVLHSPRPPPLRSDYRSVWLEHNLEWRAHERLRSSVTRREKSRPSYYF